MAVNIVEATDLIKSLEQNLANYSITKNPKAKMFKAGTYYHQTKFTIPTKRGNVVVLAVFNSGYINFTDLIEFAKGQARKGDETDARNEYASTRNKIKFKMSQAPVLGRLADLMDQRYRQVLDEMIATGQITNVGAKKIAYLVQRKYSEDERVPEDKRGKDRDDPQCSIKLDWGTYSKTHPKAFLKDTPKMKILDFDTRYEDEEGKIQYLEATINGARLTEDNIHEFMCDGYKIHGGRLEVTSSVGSTWISHSYSASELIVERGGKVKGFNIVRSEPQDEVAVLRPVQPVMQPAVQPVMQPVIQPAIQPTTPAVQPAVPAQQAAPQSTAQVTKSALEAMLE